MGRFELMEQMGPFAYRKIIPVGVEVAAGGLSDLYRPPSKGVGKSPLKEELALEDTVVVFIRAQPETVVFDLIR